MTARLCFFVCRNFQKELHRVLEDADFENVSQGVFPAMCGHPMLTPEALAEGTADFDDYDARIVLGSCCLDRMHESQEEIPGLDLQYFALCFYMFADKTLVDRLVREGAYLMTPGWLETWEDSIARWGFDRDGAREFFAESSKKLVLLDTGVGENSAQLLHDFAAFVKRPCEAIPVGLEQFRLLLKTCLIQWQRQSDKDQHDASIDLLRKRNADYLMMLELFNDLMVTVAESELIRKILDMFSMLFAAGEIVYLPMVDGEPGEPQTPGPVAADACQEVVKSMLQLNTDYQWTASGDGFLLRIQRHDEVLGYIAIDQLAFPEHKERYLNMALAATAVCGMAVENVRAFEKIVAAEESLRSSYRLLEEKNRAIDQANLDLTAQKSELSVALEDLRNTQKQLVEAEKMASLGHLVAGVAHEINTPVSVGITAASSLLLATEKISALFAERKMAQSDLKAYLETGKDAAGLILSNLNRTGDLIKHFKSLSIDQLSEQEREFGLKKYLEAVAATLAAELAARGVEVRIDCDETLYLKSFPGLFAEILTNCVGNSLKHAFGENKGGIIEIEAFADDGWLHLLCRDNGEGAPEEVRRKIFDPFFTTNPQKGAGLGMHIVYNIVVHKMKGSIECAEAATGGLEVRLKIPVEMERRDGQ